MTIRRATQGDVEVIAVLFRRTREKCMSYLPRLHTPSEDIEYFGSHVLPNDAVWVAEHNKIVGFVAFTEGWLHHLYVDPEHQGGGIGSSLLAIATKDQSTVSLWVFQRNAPAIRFYVSHGFELIKETDGAENEERMPDALYRIRAASVPVEEVLAI